MGTNYRGVLNTTVKLRHVRATRGFSLVEALAVVFIFSLIFAGLITALYGGQDLWYTADIQIQLNQEARKPLLTMIRELRQTAPTKTNIAQGASNNNIVFVIPQDTDGDGDVINAAGAIEWSSDITYLLANNQILRRQNGLDRILANDITNLQFSRPAGELNIIEISITAQRSTVLRRNLQADITASAKMRN